MKIRKGDTIKVITGKDRGIVAKVLRVFPNLGQLTIEGVNFRWKHKRSRRAGQKGQRLQIAAPVHISNVMLVCPHCSKATRPGHRFTAEGTRVRYCKKCQGEI